MLDGTHYFECICGSDEHTLKFVLDKEDRTIFTSVYLNQHRRFFKRLWVAIKYLFQYKCRYGHWDCFELRVEDTERLRNMCDEMLSLGNKNRLDLKGMDLPDGSTGVKVYGAGYNGEFIKKEDF